MKTYQRFLIAVPTWIIFEVLSWVPVILGIFIVPVCILFRQVIPSPITGKPITTAPHWLWLWGNDENGYIDPDAAIHGPPNWVKKLIKTVSLDMWWWAAIRNPVHNLTFVKWLYPPPDKNRIQFIKGDWWALTWQGWRYHLTCIRHGIVFTVGWKYYPSDKTTDDFGWRNFGCGFAMRISSLGFNGQDSLDG